uniref:WAP domain-containing protein n=1 Tax=Salarias fasciatus TaxID=181472 RepID=A0A672IRG4_SALFA
MEGRLSAVCALILILCAVGHSDATEKPGVCPRFFWQKGLICALNVKPVCRFDFDCPFDHKCCRNQCGAVCAAPIFVKPGVCPNSVWYRNLKCPQTEIRGCSHDYNCPGTLKCCYNGCGQLTCLKPRGEM